MYPSCHLLLGDICVMPENLDVKHLAIISCILLKFWPQMFFIKFLKHYLCVERFELADAMVLSIVNCSVL